MPRVTIYTDTWGIPHTFLGITDSNGNTIYRGFGPKKPGLWGEGVVKDDSGHEYQHAYEMDISQKQYEDLIENISKSAANPEKYNIFHGTQCTVWAMDMLYESGIIEPFGIFKPDYSIGNNSAPAGFAQTLLLNPYYQMIGHLVDDLFKINSALDYWGNKIFSISIYDPLALDLNGDGKIGISPASNGGAYFDHNGDGVSHKSSWINKEDGILAYDRNGNGNIDNGGELFGNFTQIKDKESNQRLAKDGYEALKEFDSNNDGLIDKNDDKFKDLKIWQDANSNGISDEGELKSLDGLGIASLSLNHNEVNEDLGGGNTLTLKGSYTKTNGQTMLMGDINFNV